MISERFSIEFNRLKIYFAVAYVGSVFLLTTVLLMTSWEHCARLAGSYGRAARHGLSVGDTHLTLESLRPALDDDFIGIEVLDDHGRHVIDVPDRWSHESWNPLRTWYSYPLQFDAVDGHAGRRLTVRFDWNVGWLVLIVPLGSIILLAIFSNVFRAVRRRLELTQSMEISLERERTERRVAEQMAHDIRSPISAVNMVLARKKAIEEPERELLARAANRIHEIANGLLDKATPPAAKETARVDAREIVRQVFSELTTVHGRRSGLELLIDIDESQEPLCLGNTRELTRAISNLANNAIDAIAKHGRVTLAIRHEPRAVNVVVADDGCGMPPAILKKLGNERVTFGKAAEGHGLGALHAAETVRACGGTMKVTSREGRGTIVSIRLPRFTRAAEAILSPA